MRQKHSLGTVSFLTTTFEPESITDSEIEIITLQMSTKPSSRWANTKDDDALEAKIKRDKEEKKRRKAEKGRRIKEEQAAVEASQRQAGGDLQQQDLEHRPAKRRRLSAGREGGASAVAEVNDTPAKTLRFDGGTWGRSRSVETYDKLNDIEEGTYGWVARATQRATGKVVALKRLKLEPGDRNGLPVTGLREIQILRECRHRNIVAMEEVVVGEQTTKPDKWVLTSSGLSPRLIDLPMLT